MRRDNPRPDDYKFNPGVSAHLASENLEQSQLVEWDVPLGMVNRMIAARAQRGLHVHTISLIPGIESPRFWILWERIPQPTTYPSEGL
jgi:hypothetical protein